MSSIWKLGVRSILAFGFTGILMFASGCDGGNNNAPASTTITTTSPLAAGTVGTAYGPVTLVATGGTAPYTWTVAAGSALPAGLTLSPAGVISGTPTTAETANFTVLVTDSATPAGTATKALSITVNVAGAALSITTTSPLAAGTVGTVYSPVTLAASGGTAPYTWTLAAGSPLLPAGLTLSPAGVISGTPTTAETANFTVLVTDSATPAGTATQALSITVSAAGAALTINTVSPLPAATFGTAYSQTLDATGGSGAYSWVVSVGTLPTGLSLNISTGVISGTPTAPAVPDATPSNFTVGVTGAVSGSATKPFAITASLSASASSGRTTYDARCTGCHQLGIYDTTGGAPNLGSITLALINAQFSGGQNHNGTSMTPTEIDEMFAFASLY